MLTSFSTVLFLDSRVDAVDQWLAGLGTGVRGVVLRPDQDGVAQISQVLRECPTVDGGQPVTVMVVAHGAPGFLRLGNGALSLDTLAGYADQLRGWFPAGGSLALYGCNVAAGDAGAELIEQLHHLTGATLHASAQRLGQVGAGHHWGLEVAVSAEHGEPLPEEDLSTVVATEVLAAYRGHLADPIATANALTATKGLEQPVDGNVLLDDDGAGADSDADGDALSVTDINGVALSGGTVNVTTQYGSIEINPDGTYTYLLDSTSPEVQAIGEGQTLTETIEYTITDGNTTATATLTVTVEGNNSFAPLSPLLYQTIRVGSGPSAVMQLVYFDPITQDYTLVDDLPVQVNATAYNTSDNFLYAVAQVAGTDDLGQTITQFEIVRIDNQGQLTGTDIVVSQMNGGDFDDSGNYWIRTQTGLSQVNLETGAIETFTFSGASVPNSMADVVYLDGTLYGAGGGDLYILDVANASGGVVSVTSVAVTGLPATAGAQSANYGAAWVDASGALYVGLNSDGVSSGAIYEITGYEGDPPSPSATLVTTVTTTSVNDGASDPRVTSAFGSPFIDLGGANPFLTELTFTEGDAALTLFPTVTLNDPDGGGNIANVTITLAGISDGADEVLLANGNSLSLGADGSVVASLGGSTFTLTYTAATGTIVVTDGDGGDLVLADVELLLESLQYQNTSTSPGPQNRGVTVELRDVDNNVVQASGIIDLVPVNTAPTSADGTVSATEDTAYTFLTTDFAYSDGDGEPLATVTLVSLPAGGTLTLNGSPLLAGTVVDVADITAGNLVFTPAENANGAGLTSFTFQVSDGTDTSAIQTITIDVAAENDDPTVANEIADQSIDADASLNFAVPGDAFADVDAGDSLTLTATQDGGAPLPSWLSFDGTTFTGTPTLGDVGPIAVTVTAEDLSGATVTDTFTLTVVNPANTPPTFVGLPGNPAFTQQTGTANPFDGLDLGSNTAPTFADLDGDGDFDALIGTKAGTLEYFENTGTATEPTFVQQTGTANPFDGVSPGIYLVPIFTDFDGDGDLDVVIGENAGNLNYFENTGTTTEPTFVEQTGTANPFDGIDVGTYSKAALADLDGDGDLDVVIGEFYGTLSYFENTGTVTEASYTEQFGTANPFDGVDVGSRSAPTLVDVDSDGDLDAFVGEFDGSLIYFENTGTATEATFVQQTGPDNPFDGVDVGRSTTSAFADLDGDGDLDVLVGENAGNLNYFENTDPGGNPIPTQAATEDSLFSFTFPAAAFVDTDPGDTLTLTAKLSDGSDLPPWLSFDGSTFSGTPVNADVGSLSIEVTATDLSGATATTTFTLDIANTNDDPTVDAGIGNQSATEDLAFSFAVPGNAFADEDVGDNLTFTAELSGGGELPSWLTFDGTTFSGTPENGDVGTITVSVTAEDDSGATVSTTFDLEVTNTNDDPVFVGVPVDPEFTEQTGTNNPFNGIAVGIYSAPTLADLDGDGDLDAVIGESGGNLNYFENTGSATEASFSEQTGVANPFDGIVVGLWSDPTFADLDGDGDLDAVVGEFNGTLNYFENTGSATEASFSQQTGVANPFDGIDVGGYSDPTFADLDGDGDLDAVIGESGGTLNYFENTGSATEANFSQQTGVANPFDGIDVGSFSAPTFADLDGDGDLDAVVGEFNGNLNYFENTGSATEANFSQQTGVANPFDGIGVGYASDPTFADLDGDGDLDAVIGESGGTLNYFENTTSPVSLDQTATEDSLFSFTFPAAAFEDVDAGDSLTLSATLANGDPLPPWLSFDGTTFSGTPENGDVGSLSIEVTATDLAGATATTTFTLDIANTNDDPTVDAGIGNQSATEDLAFSFAVPGDAFADEDVGDNLTFTAELSGGGELPSWLTFDGTTFSGTPENGDVGTITVSVTATDDSGATVSTTFDLEVTNTNDDPVFVGVPVDPEFTEQTGTNNPFDGIDVGFSNTPTFADLDGDGDLDAVIGEQDGNLNYFENTGSATEASFSEQTGVANPFDGIDVGDSSAPTLADLDGDGDLDAVVGEFDGTLNYFENTGSATEANFSQQTGVANPFDGIDVGSFSTPTFADLDGDGDLDAVIGEVFGTLNYFENTGSATEASFSQQTGVANPFDGIDVGDYSTPTLADLDGDGDLDAVVGELFGTLNYFENTSSATEASFSQQTGVANPFDGIDVGFSSAPTFADLDGDGDLDAVIGESGGTLNYFENTTPPATLDQTATEDSAFSFTFPAAAFEDVDAGDTLTLSATLANGDPLPPWLTFDGSTFSGTPENGDVGSLSIEVTATDLSGAEATTTFTLDIANTNDDPTVDAGIGNQSATEDAAFSFTVPGDAFADEDVGDNLTFTAELSGGGELPSWLTFDGTTFSGTPENGDVGTITVSVTAEDNSGATVSTTFDLEVTNTNDDPVFVGLPGDPEFTGQTGTANPFDGVNVVGYSAPTFADLDGDGDLDAVIGEVFGTLNYFENTGSATEASFSEQTGVANPFDGIDVGDSSDPTLADLDGDGDLDAVIGEFDGTLTYFENTGSATEANFSQQTGVANPFDGIDVGFSSAPTFADLDGDGDLDAVIGENDGTLTYFENTGSATEASFSQQTGVANPFDGIDVGSVSDPTLADLDGDGDLDAVIGEFDGTLTYFENTGSATEASFSEQTDVANPFDGIDVGYSSAPTFADLDGDGDLDAVVGEYDGTLNYFENIPTPGPISTQSATEDSVFTYTIPAEAFADVDAGDSLTLTAKLSDGSDLPPWLTFDGTTFSGTPENGDVGSLSIEVTATDLSGATATTTFTLDIANTNDDPTVDAGIGNQSATEDAAFSFAVPGDAFADVDVGDTLTFTAELSGGGELPSWLTFDGTTFSGTPENGDVGTITVSVTAEDNSGATVSTTFDLEVINTNDAPTLEVAIGNQTTAEDSAFVFTVPDGTFDDVDANDTLTLTATLANGDPLPTWLSFDGSTFSGTPENGDVGTISVTVTATDLAGEAVSDTFDIEVTNTNDDPTVDGGIGNQSATEDSAFVFTVPGDAFADVDVGDSLSLTATLADGSALPTWLSFSNGVFSGTPLNDDVGTITVEVTAEDNSGATVSTTFDLEVINTNDAPTLEVAIGNQTTAEDSAFVFTVPDGTFDDVDANDTLTLTATLANGDPLPTWLSFDGSTFSGTPENGDVGTISVTVTATDLAGEAVSDTFDIEVTNTNDDPTVDGGIGNQSATEDSAFVFTVPGDAFADVDVGDSLSLTATLADGSALPTWLSFSNGVFSGTPENDDVGTITVEVTAEDNSGATVSTTFDLEVINTNDAPTLEVAIGNQTTAEDSAFVFTVPAGTFDDVDANDTLTLTATLANGDPLPTWLSFDGSTFSGTPENGDVGTISVTVTATDLAGEAVSDTFDIEVTNTNDDPTVDGGIGNQSATEDSAFVFTVPGNAFADVDVGDSLSLTATLANGDPLPSWLSFNGTTFSGTPLNDDVGSLTIEVTATDLSGATTSTTFVLDVANTNDEPTLEVAIGNQTTAEDSAFVFTVPNGTFDDVDANDSLTLTATLANGDPLPAWLTFTDGTFTGTPENGDVGTISVTVTATDVSGAEVSDTFDIEVTNTNDIPTLETEIGDQSVDEDNSLLFTLPDGTFDDVDLGDSLTLTATLANGDPLPTWLSFSNGVFSGTPENDDVGTLSVTVTATDLAGESVSDTFDIEVVNTNDTPTLEVEIGDQTVDEDSALVFVLPEGTFEDVDLGDSLTLTATLANGDPLPSWLTFTNGTFSGVPINEDVGTLSVTVTATDLSGESVSDTFDIEVVNTNDTPTLEVEIEAQSTAEDSPFSFTLPDGTFGDVDAGDVLTLTATLVNGDPLPSWLTFTDGTFSGTPENADVGSLIITVTATDLAGATVSDTVTLEVTNTNDTPTVETVIGAQTATEDSLFVFTVPDGTFEDVDLGDSLTLTATLANGDPLPEWLTFAEGTFSGTPTNDDVGTIAVTVTATDLLGAAASDTFDLTIANTNDGPTLDSEIPDQVAPEDSLFTFAIPEGTFGDVDAGDTLAVTATLANGDPLPAWLTFDASTLTFSGTPLNEDVGTLTLLVTAVDLAGESVTDTVEVVVTNTNDAPEFSVPADQVVLAENSAVGTLVYTATATDIEGDGLTYSLTQGNQAGIFAIDETTGAITVADSSLLNFESFITTFNLVVEVVDDSADGPLTSTLDLTITLSDVGEHADFNGDGISDALIQDANTGIIYVGISSSDPSQDLTFQSLQAPFGSSALFNWTPEAIADMDGDGKEDDFLMRNIFNSTVFIATTEFTDGQLQLGELINFGQTDANWYVGGVGDFDGDFLQDDVVWYNSVTQESYIWYSTEGIASDFEQIVATTGLGTEWQLAGVGDFDTDNTQDDLLFLNTVTGENYIWFMEGADVLGFTSLDVEIGNESLLAGLQVAGVGDYDGDLKADDILWQNTIADITAIWFTENGSLVDTVTKVDESSDVTIAV